MILISVELKSANGPDRDRHLGKATISNMATGTDTTGNYEATFYSRRGIAKLKGLVHGFKRKRRTHWDLLFLSLVAALGKDKCMELLKEIDPELSDRQKRNKSLNADGDTETSGY